MDVNSYQADTHKTLIDDPESEIHIPNCKTYIASNDKRFFSPFIKREGDSDKTKEDSTITQFIQKEFDITCNSPEKILDIVLQNSKDNT